MRSLNSQTASPMNEAVPINQEEGDGQIQINEQDIKFNSTNIEESKPLG